MATSGSVADMRWIWNIIKVLPLGVGVPTLIGAASIGPNEAASNLSKWAHWVGLNDLPDWLIAKGADHEAILIGVIFAVVYSTLIWIIPALWGLFNNNSANIPINAFKVVNYSIYFAINEVIFDPNGPTEMYADFIIDNSGPPSIVKNWSLSIYNPFAKEHYNLFPRWVDLDKLTPNRWGHPQRTNITQVPLDTGESWPGRAGFTIIGQSPREKFGKEGTVFELSGQDIGGNRIVSPPYRLPRDVV